ncbi:MAG: hypothetical protein JG774_97 [Desulfomicrobiaceae bacterium]|jgi:multimeric flavodoxin WrbA|nr:hypothetical protein [Desulfomicrobiaceae bacterium]
MEIVLSLSPHQGGTTETLAAAVAGMRQARCLFLRDFQVVPCRGCGACRQGACPLAADDDAEALFAQVGAASRLILAAPVYFYHVPALAKAWIDRAQSRYWSGPSAGPWKPAAAVLVAGRSRGEELFSGIARTLRFFLPYLGFALGPVVELRGVEGPGDLDARVWETVRGGLAAWPYPEGG